MVELLIENAINKALKDGTLQAGLKDCDGGVLNKDSKVVLCNALVDSVNEAIKNGDINVVKNVTIEDGKLKVTDGTGKEKEITLPGVKSVTFNDGKMIVTELTDVKTETVLPYAKMAIGDKEVVLTNPNGEHVAVPKCADVLTAGDFDKTITKGANEAGKLGVKVKENGGLEATEDGVGIKAGDGLKVGEDGSLQIGEIFAKKPITGKGTKADPLSVEFNNKDFVVNPATGEVSLKPADTDQLTDLDAGKPALGYSSFFGYVDKARGVYVKGVPPDIKSVEANQRPTSSIDQLKDGEDYDFNGWQVASPVQVDQYLVGDDRAVWHRVNDGGMNQDGSLKTPTEWSDWRRETNVTVNMMELIALQKQVLDLTGRVAALEGILAGLVPLKDASGETQIGLIKP
jgi:hypothetical protein